jgi:L-lysine exporter family protein LysE/ArgO
MTAAATGSRSLGAAIVASLTFSLLNPHVYLDTVVFLGAVAGQFGDARWWFALGASTASLIWFFGLAYGARALSPHVAKPTFWRVLDSVIAVIMFGLAVSLMVMPLGATG